MVGTTTISIFPKRCFVWSSVWLCENLRVGATTDMTTFMVAVALMMMKMSMNGLATWMHCLSVCLCLSLAALPLSPILSPSLYGYRHHYHHCHHCHRKAATYESSLAAWQLRALSASFKLKANGILFICSMEGIPSSVYGISFVLSFWLFHIFLRFFFLHLRPAINFNNFAVFHFDMSWKGFRVKNRISPIPNKRNWTLC